MPTWAQLKEHVRSTYEVDEVNEDSLRLVFEYDDGRLQAVIISHYEAMGRSWCDFSSACCRVDQLSPREALERSFTLAVGSLCLDGEVYVVRHTVQLDNFDLGDIAVPLQAVAGMANRVEKDLIVARGA